MEAVIIKNIANSQLRLNSDNGKSMPITIPRDGQYMFKSPFEYGCFIRNVSQYELLRKIEVQRISGKRAEVLYDNNVQSIRHTTNEQDMRELHQREVIVVRDFPKTEEEVQATSGLAVTDESVDTIEDDQVEADGEELEVEEIETQASVDVEPVQDKQADLRKEIRQMKLVLKETTDKPSKKKILAKIKELQSDLKEEIKAQAK